MKINMMINTTLILLCVYIFSFVCEHIWVCMCYYASMCAWVCIWRPGVDVENHTPLLSWAGNQSNHELFNMTTLASHLDREIPCPDLPRLELLTTVTPTWHFAWVSKALVLTFCQQEFLCLVISPAPYHSLHTMDFPILTYCAKVK